MSEALLVLEDGTAFRGRGFGSSGTAFGEAVFNTALSGYQEVLTDPSYHGQIVTMTYPHIGNYGVNPEDVESSRVRVAGFVVREAVRTYSNWRATGSLHDYLSLPAGVFTAAGAGVKTNILRMLSAVGCDVTVFPAGHPAGEIIASRFDGVFLSNGPGDPAAVKVAIENTKQILGTLPLFGICLGHQILGLALGAKTYKLPFGHRGINQPVRRLATGAIEITSHNHGFAVDPSSFERNGEGVAETARLIAHH